MRTLSILALLVAGLAPVLRTPPAHDGTHEQLERLDREIAERPTAARLRLLRAELHRGHGDFELAALDLERCAEFDPTLAEVDLARARLYRDRGWTVWAELWLDRYLERAPASPLGHLERARLRARRGELAGALTDFDRALELDQHPAPGTYLERADVLLRAGDAAAALAGLERGLERLGGAVSLALGAVEVELRTGRLDAALERLERLAAGAARRERWLARRAEVLEAAGRADDARRTWRATLEAISELPPRHRATAAMEELAASARRRLRALEPDARAGGGSR